MPYLHLDHKAIADQTARKVFEHADIYLRDVYGIFRFLPPKDGDGGGGNFTITLALLCVVDGLAREIWPGQAAIPNPEQRFKKLIARYLPWGAPEGKGNWLQKGIAADQLYCEFRNPLVHELAADKPAASRQIDYVEPIIGKWGEVPTTLQTIAQIDNLLEWDNAWPVLTEGKPDENGKPRLKLAAAGLYWAVKRLATNLLDDYKAGQLEQLPNLRSRMNFPRSLDIVQVHCQGEIGKVIVGGAPEIPGATMLDKMHHINNVDDSLRRFVTLEPRASAQMSLNLVLPSTRPDADAGFMVLQADRAHAMSGSNCICVVTALLETGRVAMREPETVVRLDTPAGLVVARAKCENGRCLQVSLDNVPCFAEALDRRIETPAWGTIKADIAFGGIHYAIVDVGQIGLAIAPNNARALAEAGIALKGIIGRQVAVSHPELPGMTEIAYVMFRGLEADGAIRTCTTLPAGRVDRSPCGTGSSANLACLHARGAVKVGDRRTSRSIIGGEFTVEATAETTVGGRPAIVPRITGGAWIYGTEQLRIDAGDPFPKGFVLSDQWSSTVG